MSEEKDVVMKNTGDEQVDEIIVMKDKSSEATEKPTENYNSSEEEDEDDEEDQEKLEKIKLVCIRSICACILFWENRCLSFFLMQLTLESNRTIIHFEIHYLKKWSCLIC